MSSIRHTVFTAIALALWSQPFTIYSAETNNSSVTPAAADGASENSISGVLVKPGHDGDWLLDFDYALVEKMMIRFRIEVIPKPGAHTPGFRGAETRLFPPKHGRHHISTLLQYPGEGTSAQIIVSMVREADGDVLASQRIDKVIQWPTQDERALRNAIDTINTGGGESLNEARLVLERLIGKNPNNEGAYVELARIAMKSNWGPEGLHHAETLLDSALKIRPDSVNAKILLGYVYTHQQRFREAEALFVDVAPSDPVNLWLWTNWGEMLDMQGKANEAIVKYREALTRPVRSGQYHGARTNAYAYLLKSLEVRKDLDGIEALHKQRIGDLGPGSCDSVAYARFRLNVRGDAQGAIDLARSALGLICEEPSARQILGLASYVLWAQGTAPSNSEALNQARVYLPAGAMALYLLASGDNTMVAAKKLVAAGEAIDQIDNEKMTALGHALRMGKLETAEHLLSLGASPEKLVGYEEIPVAFLPVLAGNVEAIRLMQRAGVDYSKLRYGGATAIDYAKQMDDDALLKLLRARKLAL